MLKTEINSNLLLEYKPAQFELGKACYEREDYDEAIELLREPAIQNHIEAQFYLGKTYTQQHFYEQAIRWFTKASKQKHPEAQFYLGEAYFYGKGVVLNYEHALECYQYAAEQGNDDAKYKLNENYGEIKRLITTKEYKKAVIWSKFANPEDIKEQYKQKKKIKAQYELALMFDTGEGVYKNSDRAVELWREAASQGDSESQYRLWHKEAELRNIKVQYRLGSAYYEGWGNNKHDETKAIKWWQKAAKQGHITAQYNLGIIYSKAKDHKNALQCFNTVAKHTDKGNALVIYAQYLLGIMYKNGEGCSQNYQKSRKWLKKATGFEKDKSFPENDRDFLEVVLDEDNTQEELITIVQISAQEALEDIAKLEEKENAKKELEDIMSMFAHKFRGPLRSIRNNMEYNSPKQATLESVQTMSGLINIFSVISTDAQILCKQLQQDQQGHSNLLTVLNKSLALAIEQLLSIDNIDIISQHYFNYAKKTGQVSMTTTSDEWEENYLVLEKKLQASWLNDFKQLANSDLEILKNWIEKRFFPLELLGFNDNMICFEYYKAKESTLLIVMTEIILNAVKYYSSQTNETIKLVKKASLKPRRSYLMLLVTNCMLN